jgi:hypothetical protein
MLQAVVTAVLNWIVQEFLNPHLEQLDEKADADLQAIDRASDDDVARQLRTDYTRDPP